MCGSFDADGSTPFSPVESCPLSTAKSTGLTDDNGCDFDVDKHNEEQAMLENFYSSLDEDLTLWLNYLQNKDFKLLIEDYLKANMKSLYSFTFAKEAIKAKKEDGRNEVDFNEKIIKEKEFEENPCLGGILNELNTNEIASSYLNNFEGEKPVAHLKFTASSLGQGGPNAQTHSPQNFIIEIEFNTDLLGRSKTNIVRTFVHELIHAEMYRKLLAFAAAPNLSNLTVQQIEDNRDNFPGIYDYWTRYVINPPAGQNPTSPQHNLMAQHFIDTIVNTIQQYDPSLSNEVAEALAWTGLQQGVGSDSSSRLDPITGLVVDPSGNNVSTVAWTNKSNVERLNLIQLADNYNSTQSSCQ